MSARANRSLRRQAEHHNTRIRTARTYLGKLAMACQWLLAEARRHDEATQQYAIDQVLLVIDQLRRQRSQTP